MNRKKIMCRQKITEFIGQSFPINFVLLVKPLQLWICILGVEKDHKISSVRPYRPRLHWPVMTEKSTDSCENCHCADCQLYIFKLFFFFYFLETTLIKFTVSITLLFVRYELVKSSYKFLAIEYFKT